MNLISSGRRPGLPIPGATEKHHSRAPDCGGAGADSRTAYNLLSKQGLVRLFRTLAVNSRQGSGHLSQAALGLTAVLVFVRRYRSRRRLATSWQASKPRSSNIFADAASPTSSKFDVLSVTSRLNCGRPSKRTSRR